MQEITVFSYHESNDFINIQIRRKEQQIINHRSGCTQHTFTCIHGYTQSLAFTRNVSRHYLLLWAGYLNKRIHLGLVIISTLIESSRNRTRVLVGYTVFYSSISQYNGI